MGLKGARHEPHQGVKGAKPRLRLPREPRRQETSESAELGEEYLIKRNRLMELKIKRESMSLGFDRGRLIERELVIRQLAFLLIAMRQRLLPLPNKARLRFGPQLITDEVHAYLTLLVAEALREIAELPRKSTDPDWLEGLEEEKEP